MPIISTDIKYRLSGGASNTDPLLALGGVVSSTDAGSNLLDAVSSAEAAAGDIEYRAFYVRNNHGSLTLLGAKVWINANTPSADTDLAIGLGTSAVSATEQTVATTAAAPSGVTFSAAANEAAGLTIGDLAPGETKAVWLRRVVTAAAAATNDTATLRVKGDTLP